MDTVVTGIVVIAVIFFAIVTLSEHYLLAQDAISQSWQEMEARLEERSKTDLLPIGAETMGGGAIVNVTFRNEGRTKLADFDRWDVIVQYRGIDGQDYVQWLPYFSSGDTWVEIFPVEAEVFDPGIFNPGDEVVIQISVSPSVMAGTTNLATVVTTNGISASAVFTR
jgi:hypothetical protein